MQDADQNRRDLFKLGAIGLAGGAVAAASGLLDPRQAAAQANPNSLLRKVLDRGKLLVGTGSTNAPWHFEDDKGQLVGMDIAMAQILSKALFDKPDAIEFTRQDPAARIPNINTGKVDIVIQFMTMNFARAQIVDFSRPYYVEGVALLTAAGGKRKSYDELNAGGKDVKCSVLQNADAETLVTEPLPQAQPVLIDTQANVIQALDSGRVDCAAVDLSTVRWLVARNPDKYVDAGHSYRTQLYGAAMKKGDQDWLNFVNMVFNIAMFGHQNEIYDAAFKAYFGLQPPMRKPGFPSI